MWPLQKTSGSHQEPIFSEEDVEQLLQLFPSESAFMIPSSTNTGLHVRQNVASEFEERIKSESRRVAVASLSHDLDISQELVVGMIEEHSSLALLSADQSHVIPKHERDALWTFLCAHESEPIVSVTEFCRDKDLCQESLMALVQSINTTLKAFDNSLVTVTRPGSETELYLIDELYQSSLSTTIENILHTAQEDSESATLKSQKLSSNPPLWLVLQLVHHHASENKEGRFWRIEQTTDTIVCIPQQAIVRKRDDQVERLREGIIPYIDIPIFAQAYEAADSANGLKYFKERSASLKVKVISTSAISLGWLDTLASKASKDIRSVGYADISTTIIETYPADIRAEVIDLILATVRSATPDEEVRHVDKFFLRDDYCDDLRSMLLKEAQSQARDYWEKSDQGTQHDPQFQISKFIDPPDTLLADSKESRKDGTTVLILQALADGMKDALENGYANELLQLEVTNEKEFALFWSDRVGSRFRHYNAGANAIEDSNLRDQLLELLLVHVLKELIPEALARARTKGYLKSRKTRKNIQRLHSILTANPDGGKAISDISAMSTAVEKFERKQGIEKIDSTSLAKAKDDQIGHLSKSMQKYTDGPQLFLTLVVILLANHQEGIVYATGKFAPKLMKLMRRSMAAQDYDQLVKWKDAVRAGTLSDEGKSQIKAMAGAR